MTPEGEDVRSAQRPVPEVPGLPRLFAEGAVSAGEGDLGGALGVGEADSQGADQGPLAGGVRAEVSAPDDDFVGLLDRDCLGVRGERPASRRELAELILRYRDEQASQRARRKAQTSKPRFSPEQRLLILDSWLRSKLPAGDFAPLVGLSMHTLRAWKARFAELGPAGLDDKPLGRPTGSRLSEATKRAILLLKEQHPDWGQDRIAAVLLRSQGFSASATAIGRALVEAGYVAAPDASKPHAQEPKHFERARANQLWQTDLFTFVLKRENRRVHLVAFLDDHSRFVVGYGLHATASGALVRETLLAAVANFGAPQEVLTDNGTQYVTWRGKSEFTKLLEQRGIRQIVATPRHPETLGKIERFWGTLWRECVETAVFRGLDDARRRIGLFIDHYNFQRPHSGIGGLVPADRFFAAAPQVLATLKERVAKNAAELARDGLPRKPFYLTGRIGDQSISLHAEGEKVVLTNGDGRREEVDLGATGPRQDVSQPVAGDALPAPLVPMGSPADHPATADGGEPAPGGSVLDDLLPGLLGEEAGE